MAAAAAAAGTPEPDPALREDMDKLLKMVKALLPGTTADLTETKETLRGLVRRVREFAPVRDQMDALNWSDQHMHNMDRNALSVLCGTLGRFARPVAMWPRPGAPAKRRFFGNNKLLKQKKK